MAKPDYWSAEMVARLAGLRKDGLSFKQIAAVMSAEFKRSLSRDACLGVARRHQIFSHPISINRHGKASFAIAVGDVTLRFVIDRTAKKSGKAGKQLEEAVS